MTDFDIIFSARMVRALIEGRKKMTRRLLYIPRRGAPDAQGRARFLGLYPPPSGRASDPFDHYWTLGRWHKAKPGDRLWVRENWRVSQRYDQTKPRDLKPRTMTVLYDAGGSAGNAGIQTDWTFYDDPFIDDCVPRWAGKLRPAIFLPRWASRLSVVIQDVKIERLQDISEEDCRAEGIAWDDVKDCRFTRDGKFSAWRTGFLTLWEAIHGAGAWDENPWVVAIGGRVSICNIDDLQAAAA